MIGPQDVRAAARVLDGVAHRTPVITSATLGEHVVLKPENLQRGGAFKFRGAYNKISSLPKIITASTGITTDRPIVTTTLMSCDDNRRKRKIAM